MVGESSSIICYNVHYKVYYFIEPGNRYPVHRTIIKTFDFYDLVTRIQVNIQPKVYLGEREECPQ